MLLESHTLAQCWASNIAACDLVEDVQTACEDQASARITAPMRSQQRRRLPEYGEAVGRFEDCAQEASQPLQSTSLVQVRCREGERSWP